jgi:hypothetical protein
MEIVMAEAERIQYKAPSIANINITHFQHCRDTAQFLICSIKNLHIKHVLLQLQVNWM